MKLALFACLAAAAMADPEPWTVYGRYGGYAAGYPTTYGYGVSHSYGYPYSTYSHGVYGKREAEAEPKADADAQYLTTYRAGYTAPVAYSNYGYGFPATYAYGLRNFGYSRYGYGKREAEAEPEADAQYLTSYRAGYSPVAYSNYGYGFPSTYGYGLRNFGYSRYGYGKREAEAEPEADAQYLTTYRAGYTAPVAYSNYGYNYPATYGYGLRNFGYSRFGYGKREAEAEPEADAQYLTSYRAGYTSPIAYSNFGYNYPTTYGYGLRNFGYSRFGYHG